MSIGGYNVLTPEEDAKMDGIRDLAYKMMAENAIKYAQRSTDGELGESSPSNPAMPVPGAMRGDIPLSWNDKEIK